MFTTSVLDRVWIRSSTNNRCSQCKNQTLVDQDHMGWNLEILETNCTAIDLIPGGHGEILGRLEVGGVGKSGALELCDILYKRLRNTLTYLLTYKSGNISETHKDRGKFPWMFYRNSPTVLYVTIPDPPTFVCLFPKIVGLQPTPKSVIAFISGTPKATNFKIILCTHSYYVSEQKPMKNFRKNSRGRSVVLKDSWKVFARPYSRARRAVIFAIAQLSCFLFARWQQRLFCKMWRLRSLRVGDRCRGLG